MSDKGKCAEYQCENVAEYDVDIIGRSHWLSFTVYLCQAHADKVPQEMTVQTYVTRFIPTK